MDVDLSIRVVEPAGAAPRSPFPPVPTDENVAERIDFLTNFFLDHSLENGPGGKITKRPGQPSCSRTPLA